MGDVVARVRDALALPLLERGLFARLGVAPPTGVLLHGPPGTGKTLIARSVCDGLSLPIVELDTAQILSGIFGDAEASLAAAFADARARAPAVLFVDELDGIGSSRDTAAGSSAAAAEPAPPEGHIEPESDTDDDASLYELDV